MSDFRALVLDDRLRYPLAKTRSIMLYEKTDEGKILVWGWINGQSFEVAPGEIPDAMGLMLPPEAIKAIGDAINHWRGMEPYSNTPEIVDWAGG